MRTETERPSLEFTCRFDNCLRREQILQQKIPTMSLFSCASLNDFGKVDYEYKCPAETKNFDYNPCNPHNRNQCPAGFACRPCQLFTNDHLTNQISYICCDSSKMTINDWFIELGISPQIIPQTPHSQLESVTISDFAFNVPSPSIKTGDEIEVSDHPDYVTGNVKTLTFKSMVPAPGGYLHVLLLVDPVKRAKALFFSYDYPATGESVLNIDITDQNRRGFIGIVSNYSLPQQKIYRHQYVVLVYKTTDSLEEKVNISGDIRGNFENLSDFLTISPTGQMLGRPIAGTFFYLTSKRTMFRVEAEKIYRMDDSGQSRSSFILVSIITAFIIVYINLFWA
ncbi:unnamed protein product [Dracunculus medinensis]|uniref:LAM_G_DOMAIN domain-containing protein n=1 Tax=Dracunculus medinensis TaxID=318479 RepID=A0A0N4U4X5_DRAME|nr:unnamed protein product [Dracunculus medinensis]